MTAVADLIRELSERGISLEPAGGNVRVTPRDLLTDGDRQRIRACKPELIELLEGPAGPSDDPVSNALRAQLLLWGGPGDWPAVAAVGLGPGAVSWTEWLRVAQLSALARAVQEAECIGPVLPTGDRKRLVVLVMRAHYPPVPGIVEAGPDAWESWLEAASDDDCNRRALVASRGQLRQRRRRALLRCRRAAV